MDLFLALKAKEEGLSDSAITGTYIFSSTCKFALYVIETYTSSVSKTYSTVYFKAATTCYPLFTATQRFFLK
jgi:hypothetical protein